MSVITSIKPQKNPFGKLRTSPRVNIYLDDRFGFGLDLETFVKSGLKVGQELSEGDVEKIVKEGEFQSTYDKILRFATLRPRSEKEFKTWLTKHKVHQSLYEELFNRLKRLELLDDKKFAAWWVEQRLQFKSKSKKELIQELRMKGIDSEIINQLVNESINQKDQVNAAKKLIAKLEYKLKGLSGFEKRKKIYNYLTGKGFDYNIIREIVGELSDD